MPEELNNQQNNQNGINEGLDSSWKILEKPEASWTNLSEDNKSPKPQNAQINVTPQQEIQEIKTEIPIQPIPEIPKPIIEITKHPKKIWQVLKFAGVIVGIFLFIYAFLTFPALLLLSWD